MSEQAIAEKNLGDKAYEKHDFAAALKHYDAAIALSPKTPTFYTNKAAVYFEEQKYEECIEECKKAIDIGREVQADYQQIAKAMACIGNAYVKLNNLKDAVHWYGKSLSEHRDPEIVKKHKQVEKELKDAEGVAYINPEIIVKEEPSEIGEEDIPPPVQAKLGDRMPKKDVPPKSGKKVKLVVKKADILEQNQISSFEELKIYGKKNRGRQAKKFLQVVDGGIHTTILTEEHEVYSCKINKKGTCPVKELNLVESVNKMTIMEFTTDIKDEGIIKELAAGAGFTAALTDLGSVIAWGDLENSEGAYGIDKIFKEMREQPTVIIHHGDVVIVKVAAGAKHFAMLSKEGDIYTFGENTHGQLGNTTRVKSTRSKYVADCTAKSLKQIVLSNKGKPLKFTDVFAGGYWTMALDKDKRIFACGKFGQLGLPLPEIDQETDAEESTKTTTNTSSLATESRFISLNTRIGK